MTIQSFSVQQRFAAVYRLVRNNQPLTDEATIGALNTGGKLPQGGIHMNDPTTRHYYIISPPDEDTFNPLIDALGTGGRPAWDAFCNALAAKQQDIEV